MGNYLNKKIHTTYREIFAWVFFLVSYLYFLLAFTGLLSFPSVFVVSWQSVITSILCFYLFKKNKKIATFGLTGVLLLYTVCTQFGLGMIYYLLGPEFLAEYTNYTLRFLFSNQYVRAVILGNIAVMTYTIAVYTGSSSGMYLEKRLYTNLKKISSAEDNLTVRIGYIFLVSVLLYFLFLILSGSLSLNMNYASFRKGIINNNGIYSYMLVLYATGISYVISAGNKRQIKFGLIIYACTGIVLLFTGNKGEVLYAIFACIGASQYRGFKIKPKLVFLLSFLMFVLIPFITKVRQKGVLSSLDQIGFSFTDFFIEMGFQIRVTVYVLEQFTLETRDLIYGFSYYNPIFNIFDKIIPFLPLKLPKPNSFDFKTSSAFATQGFSQVAESYANFGLFGVVVFFGFLGFILAKNESKQLGSLQLAYLTSIVVIFINATRNSFAFVPGQILLMTLLFIIFGFLLKKDLKYKITYPPSKLKIMKKNAL